MREGQRCPRVAAGPYWPNGPITQLSPSLTQNRCTWMGDSLGRLRAVSTFWICYIPFFTQLWNVLALSSFKVVEFAFIRYFAIFFSSEPFPFLVGGATQHLLLTLGNLLSPYSDAILRMKITRGADSLYQAPHCWHASFSQQMQALDLKMEN